jgi:hypothetical protein
MEKTLEYDLIEHYACKRCGKIVPMQRHKIVITVDKTDTQRTKIQKVMKAVVHRRENDGSFELTPYGLLPTQSHKCDDGISYPCVFDSIEVFDVQELPQ